MSEQEGVSVSCGMLGLLSSKLQVGEPGFTYDPLCWLFRLEKNLTDHRTLAIVFPMAVHYQNGWEESSYPLISNRLSVPLDGQTLLIELRLIKMYCRSTHSTRHVVRPVLRSLREHEGLLLAWFHPILSVEVESVTLCPPSNLIVVTAPFDTGRLTALLY